MLRKRIFGINRFQEEKISEISVIKQKFEVENSVIDFTQKNQLKRFGDVQKLDDQRLPRMILNWYQRGIWKKGRTRKIWGAGVKEEINKRNLQKE